MLKKTYLYANEKKMSRFVYHNRSCFCIGVIRFITFPSLLPPLSHPPILIIILGNNFTGSFIEDHTEL